ncbi:unnamed protein product [Symbiodinium natans]|uniref:Uncharacterized protein n=1 Tax=Symbiodinium natans TaxID=878477 RepID=A0A812L4R3_9DINO|nr:unnamed protein product [Symbiodinium natans]
MEIHVQIPQGAKPGTTFQVQANGQILTVLVPAGTQPGQTISVPFQAAAPAAPVWQPPPADPLPILQFSWVIGGAFTGGFLSWIGVCVNNANPPRTPREINAAKFVMPAAVYYLGVLILYIIVFAAMVATGTYMFISLAALGTLILYAAVCATFFVRQYLSDQALVQSRLAGQQIPGTSGAVVMGQPSPGA